MFYNRGKKQISARWVVAICLIMSLLLTSTACSSTLPGEQPNDQVGSGQETGAQTNTEKPNGEDLPAFTESVPDEETVVIDTYYAKLEYPEKTFSSLVHREVKEGTTVMEIFLMDTSSGEKELFRIYYGDAQTGDYIGDLVTDEGVVPVSVYVAMYDENVFNEEDLLLYQEMMEGLGTVMSSLWNDSRFVEPQETAMAGVDKKLKLWDVRLLESMEWEEETKNGSYKVTFYTKAGDMRVKLYAAMIGEPAFESVLGMYLLDGAEKTASIEVYDLPDTTDWSESDVTELYMAMETINSVVQAIVSNENFIQEQSNG